MTDLILISEFRQYLVDQGIVRKWDDADNGLPQCVRDPRDGAPDPVNRTYAGAVVTLIKGGQVPKGPLEEFLNEHLIDVITRAYSAVDAELIQRRIQESVSGKRLLTMGSLVTEWCFVFTGDSPLGSDSASYTRMQTFRIAARQRALAGTPYWA